MRPLVRCWAENSSLYSRQDIILKYISNAKLYVSEIRVFTATDVFIYNNNWYT